MPEKKVRKDKNQEEISIQAKESMITEHYLAKCLRSRQDMKLPFAGYLEEKEVKTKMSCSSRAGLAVSVGPKDRKLCKGKQAACIGAGAPVCLAPVLQYSTYEAVDMDKEISEQSKPAHFSIAYSPDCKKIL
nr:PREDICTED: histone H2A-beta, sperm-like [Pelecanus crispus]